MTPHSSSGNPPKTPSAEDRDLKEALCQSEESYRGLFNTIRQALYIHDREGRFVEVNDWACAMYGYAREEFIGRTPEFLGAPGLNDFTTIAEKLRKAFAGETQTLEFWARRRNGEIFPKEVSLFRGTYFGNDVVLAVATDVSEKKQTEKALFENAEFYRTIVTASPDPIVITDLKGTILTVSPSSLIQFGLREPAYAEGKNIVEFIVPDDEPRVRHAVDNLVKTGVAFGEFSGRRSDGSVFPFEAHASVMRDRQGNPWRLAIFLRDISRSRLVEDKLNSALARNLNQQQVVADISASPLVMQGDVENLARKITKEAASVLGVERAGVWIFDESGTRLTCSDLFTSSTGSHTSGSVLKEEEYRNEFAALRSVRFIDADDSLTDPRTAGYVEGYIKPLNITSMLDAVIRNAGANVGVICFEHVGRFHTWEPDECSFACQLADQIALAVMNRQRIRVQQELVESEERYSSLFSNNYSVSLVIDPDSGRITEANDAASRYYGYSREQLLSMGIYDLNRLSRETVVRNLIRAKNEREKHFFSTHYLADGEKRYVEIYSGPIPVRGKPLFYSIIHDITESKRAEQEIEESEERYRTLIDRIPDYVIVHKDGILLYVNPAATANMGYTAEIPIGKSILTFIAPECHPTISKAIQKRMAGEDVPPYEIRILARDGSFHNVLVNGAVINYSGTRASLNVLTDITTLKQAEEIIKTAKENLETQVAERTAALSEANRQLTEEVAARRAAELEKSRSLDEKVVLLREIHHRVKNNLQIIASLLNLQSRFITDKNVLEAIKDSQSRVRAMALVHERIYRSSNIAEINLREYLDYLARQLLQFYNIRSNQVGIQVSMEDLTADIDTVIPAGLIMNELITNSLKHGFADGRKGTISIEGTREGPDLFRFVYRDDGAGMPAGFDWRNTESLGLRLVNNLVDQLNGTIELAEGPGTCFVIMIRQKGVGAHA